MKWTVEVVGETEKPGPESTPEPLNGLKIVLVKGRFVESTGFTVEGDRTATLGDVGKDLDHLVLMLTWEK